jgi:CDP-diacylglycerol---serine O-phosphatidyltransferase
MSRQFNRRPRDPSVRLISGRLRDRRNKVVAPLRSGVFLVPVTITSIGLMAGFYALVSAINAHFELAALMLMIAFVCDGLDGRIARLSRTSSRFGTEYDSLSDVVAFGVAPAGLIYMFGLKPLGLWGWVLSGIYVVCAALRLARFNIQIGSVDKHRFVGLPVPGAAAMIAGMVLAYSYFELDSPRALAAIAGPLTLALACLMVSRVPYPSFKGIDLRRRAQLELIIAVLMAAALSLAMPQMMTFLLATAYVLSGPALMVMGEQMTEKVPILREIVGSQESHGKAPAAGQGRNTGSLPDDLGTLPPGA